jgi:4-diphosphocytidyl-2-C-methyl-D-erythritol kinase
MTISRVTMTAPAKLNLHLEILGRRDDGFHELETLFQTIELSDRVTVERRAGAGIAMECDDATLPDGPANLAWRAAAAFIDGRHDQAGALRITLAKIIPYGAGLGGGSSDAAAVLLALDQLLPGFHPRERLEGLAAELGSDVPFFLLGGTALGAGRGERLAPMPDLPRLPVTVLMPAATLPTPAVYRELTDAERGPRPGHGAAWWRERLASMRTIGDVAPLLHNRLTAPAGRLCPAVVQLLGWLAAKGVPHLMSGSGAACFALGHIDAPAGTRSWRTWTRVRG